MKLRVLRRACIAAINAFFDIAEAEDDTVDSVLDYESPSANVAASAPKRSPSRRAPHRPPAQPSSAPSDMDRAAARQELKHMGVRGFR